MLQALIFDVDGTLADTEHLHLEAFNHAFTEEALGWHWDEKLYVDLLDISGGKERMRHYWDAQHPQVKELDAGALQKKIAHLHEIKTAYYENAVNEGRVALRPGVLPLLEEALREGLRLAIATTTSPVNIAALLRAAMGADWRSHFAAVGDASSSPVKKPDPQVYRQVLREMALPASACLAFEDSRNGLLAARACRLETVITPSRFTGHHSFAGALRVLPDLDGVTVANLRDWLGPYRAAA